MNDDRLQIDGETLAFRRGGEGPLVVFSHALGPLAWEPLDRLARTCTVAVPDWERSTVPARTMAELGWFEKLTAALGKEDATLCAWSMAGPAAIYYAAERPACLSRLILVDVAGMGPDLPPLQLRDLPHLLLTRLRGHPTRGLVRSMWRNWTHDGRLDTKRLEEATYRFFRDRAGALGDPTGTESEGEGEGEGGGEGGDEILDELDGIEVPTLVLSGRHSTVLGPHYGKVAAALLPHGKHVVFEESSHALQLEEPEKFQDAVAEFVAGSNGG